MATSLLLALAACSSGSTPTGLPPTPPQDSGAPGDGSSSHPVDAGEDGGTPDATPVDGAEPRDAPAGADGAAPVDAGPPLHEDGGYPIGAQCKPSLVWKADTAIPSISATGFDRFGSISGDELSAAWADAAGNVYVADRASAVASFGAPVQVVSATVDGGALDAGDRPALAPSGLSLVVATAGGTMLYGYARNDRSSAWAPTSQSEMGELNGMVQAGNQGQFSEPVLGGDGVSLFFMFSAGGGAPQIAESQWDGTNGVWLPAITFANPELQTPDAEDRRRPTGASGDGRTLFFYDEDNGVQRAAWRDTPSSPFTFFEDLPTPTEGSPNHLCTAVYFQGEGTVAAGLWEGQ